MVAVDNELDFRFTNPVDGDLDTFESGVVEVNQYFRRRTWFKHDKGRASPPTYTFFDASGARVGYAAVSFGKCPHPHDRAVDKEKYLVIYVVGVDLAFQGRRFAPSGTSYATTIFRTLIRFAREKEDCVGLSLWVRSDNDRAMAFYRKIGLEADENGPVARDDGTPHVTMRMLFG